MSSLNYAYMITVVGGTYDEHCFEPYWKERFGSGLRACWAINALSFSKEEIEYYTFADKATTAYLKMLSPTLFTKLHSTDISESIRFYYDHPLINPRIYPRPDTINKAANNLDAKGDNILYYGFLEGNASVKAKKVVYDPQSPVMPIPFSKTNSEADELAYVINIREAKRLAGSEDVDKIKKYFFTEEQAKVLVLKMGPKGALVATPGGKEVLIPVYKTKSVWPIGSGDIFAAVFAYHWFNSGDAIKAAEEASWQTASYCNSKDFQFSEINSNSEIQPLTINEYPPGQIYLAGPFFTFAERWLINEIRKSLLDMNLKVFSPWHDVGHGVANEVVSKDLDALDDSAIVFGVLDGLDSGTLFEIGYAVKKGTTSGRSLGTLAGGFIAETFKTELSEESREFYKYSLYNVIAAACLCHDIGNPAFGHSGEDAIASYFTKHETVLRSHFSDDQWNDFINFEGNANAIRILTQQQNGKSGGSFNLTTSTLAAIAKYPCESSGKEKGGAIHRKKFGFFQSESAAFEEIARSTSMIQENNTPIIFKRHPFVWLVEAADDICYTIIDLEDAHRLSIIEHSECRDLLVNLIDCIGDGDIEKIKTQLGTIGDKNEKIGFLRAKSIHALIMKATEIYTSDFAKILTGDYKTSIFDTIASGCEAITKIISYSVNYIYNHRSVVEIENAGYNVMSELLSHFIPPVLSSAEKITMAEKKAVKLIPYQFQYPEGNNYQKVMGVIDYVSGMTDNYATDLYRKIKGIEIGMTN